MYKIGSWDDDISPIYGKIIHSCSKPPTRYVLSKSHWHLLNKQLSDLNDRMPRCQWRTFGSTGPVATFSR